VQRLSLEESSKRIKMRSSY